MKKTKLSRKDQQLADKIDSAVNKPIDKSFTTFEREVLIVLRMNSIHHGIGAGYAKEVLKKIKPEIPDARFIATGVSGIFFRHSKTKQVIAELRKGRDSHLQKARFLDRAINKLKK